MLFFPTRGRLTGVHPNSSLLGFSAALACPKFHPYERHRNPMLLYNQPKLTKSRSSHDITRIDPGLLLKEINPSRSRNHQDRHEFLLTQANPCRPKQSPMPAKTFFKRNHIQPGQNITSIDPGLLLKQTNPSRPRCTKTTQDFF